MVKKAPICFARAYTTSNDSLSWLADKLRKGFGSSSYPTQKSCLRLEGLEDKSVPDSLADFATAGALGNLFGDISAQRTLDLSDLSAPATKLGSFVASKLMTMEKPAKVLPESNREGANVRLGNQALTDRIKE